MLFVWTDEKRFLDRILNPTSPLSPGSFFPSHSDYWWGIQYSCAQITGKYLLGLLFPQPPGVPRQVLVPLPLRTDLGG